MTSPKTQIQALINKIDEVLGDSGTPRSSTEPSGGIPQQQVLEQARNYLASLQGSAASPASPDRPRLDIAQQEWWRDRPATAPMRPANPAEMGYTASPAESAQQVLQAIVQEMNYLRVNMMQPMREELMGLYQQRQFLTADIQRLEQQRHQLLLSQQQVNQQQVINDFMQSLMGRLQEQLATQIAQSVENLQFQATQNAGMLQNAPVPQLNPGESVGEPLTPGQRLQQMQQLQARSDEMLTKLDSTLRVVFDSLQSNVDSYQDSLGQGLSKMHGLGQQGEAMFAALVNRLAEQLGRGASQYIQTSISPEWELPGLQGADSSSSVAEKSPQSSQHGGIAEIPDELPQDQVDRMLNTLEPEDSPVHEPETDRSNDSLLDDLLAELPQSAATQSVDFNLDDLQLPIDDSFMGAIAKADESAPSEPESGDGADIDEMVTLFSIEDEGVIDRVDDQRLNQLDEQDADLFLSELNELTAHSEPELDAPSHPSETGDETALSSYGGGDASGEIDDSQALDRGGAFSVPDDSDEALTFLDQIATEIESDLTPVPPQEMTGDDLDLFDEASRFDESTSAADAPADEIEDVYQMFDSAVTSGLSSDSDFEWNSDEESQSDPEALDAPEGDRPSEPSLDEIAPGLLDELLFDDSVSLEQTAASTLGSGLGSELVDSDAEEQTDENADIFSELGFSTQDNSADSSELQSEQIEAIHTLDELMGLDQSDEPRQTGDDWMDEASNLLSSDDDAPGTDFDRYIMASPDEDLLASDDSDAVVGSNLKLDSTTMQRLASDLSGFEGIDESEVLLPSEEASEPSFEDVDEDAEEDALSEGRSPTLAPEAEDLASAQQASGDADESFGDMPSDDRAASTPFASLESVESSEAAPDDLDPDMSDWDDFEPDESMSESLFAFGDDDEDVLGLGEAESRESESGEFESGALELGEFESSEFESSEFESSEFEPEAVSDEGTENAPFVTSEPSVTVDDLFGASSESSLEEDGDRPEEQFDPLDSDELRQIFADLKALDDQEIEPSPGSQEQTLVDLLKGMNQPSLPNLPDADGETENSSAETDTSWSIFDDLNTPGSSSESEQKKNSDSV